jgi:hypothetical protein
MLESGLRFPLSLNRPNRRKVLECGGWRGTGLTPLLEFMARVQTIAVCALAPHPPHSKTLPRDAVHGPNARPKLELRASHEQKNIEH